MINSIELLSKHDKIAFLNSLWDSFDEGLKIQYIAIYELKLALKKNPEQVRNEIFEEFSEKYCKSLGAVQQWYYRKIKK